MNKGINKNILTWICYLGYYFTGTLITTTGIMLAPLGEFFDIQAGQMGYVFTCLNLGMWFSIFITGYILRNTKFKTVIVVSVIFTIFLTILLNILKIPIIFQIFMVGLGVIGGAFMMLSSYLIIEIYQESKERSKQVIFTDFFFSFAGATIPLISSYYMSQGYSWMIVYYFIAIIALAILTLALMANFKSIEDKKSKSIIEFNTTYEKWGISLYTISIAAFLFILGQLIYVFYFPAYFYNIMHFTEYQSAMIMTIFWTSQCVSLFVSRFFTKKIRIDYLILICIIIATSCLFCLIHSTDYILSYILAIVFGFFNALIYSGLLAFGSLQIKKVPPTLISNILTYGTTGTLLSGIVGGWIVHHYSLYLSLMASVFFYIIIIFLVIISIYFSKMKKIIF